MKCIFVTLCCILCIDLSLIALHFIEHVFSENLRHSKTHHCKAGNHSGTFGQVFGSFIKSNERMTIVEYSMHFSGPFNIYSPKHYSTVNVSGLCKTAHYLTAACLCEWKKICNKTIKATKNHTGLQLKCSILNNSTLSWELSLTINQYVSQLHNRQKNTYWKKVDILYHCSCCRCSYNSFTLTFTNS